MSNNFYDDMKDVINNKRYRDFSDYDDFREMCLIIGTNIQ